MAKLYIGCGPWPFHPQHLEVLGNVADWTLIDAYVENTEHGFKKWDARYLTNWVEPNTVEEIYCSHTLEHFEHAFIPAILDEWHGLMKPGAKITINVPNLLWLCRQATRLEGNSRVESEYYTEWLGEHGLLSVLYGSQSHEGEYHKSAYTPKLLQGLLVSAGFKNTDTLVMEDAHQMGVIIATANA